MRPIFKINQAYLYTIVVFFTIASYLLSSYPIIFCQFLPIPSITIITVLTIGLLAILLIFKRNLTAFIPAFNIVVVVQIATWLFFTLYHSDSSYVTRIVFIVAAYLSLLAIHNCNGGILRFAKLYNYAILMMAVCGMLCFFLVLLFSFQPLFEFQNPDERTAYFFGLTCTNSYYGDVIRYAGFFDEPGAMAYWGVFALLFNRLFFRNSVYEKILIVSLAFTFSLAYYIQLIIYILLMKSLTLKQYILAFIILVTAFFIISEFENSEYGRIYDMTISRMEYDSSDGTLEGDNRSELAVNARKYFEKAPIMGNGARKMGMLEGTRAADNPYEILAKDGIIGFLVTYSPLILVLLLKLNNREILFSILILAAGYMQRPFHVNCMHCFMLYMFVLLCLQKEYNPNIQTKSVH